MYHSSLYSKGRQILYYPPHVKQMYSPKKSYQQINHHNHNYLKNSSADYGLSSGPKSKKQLEMLYQKLKNKNLSHPGFKIRHPHDVYEEDIELVYQEKNGKGSIYVGNLEAAQNLQTLQKLGIGALLTACKGVHIRHPSSHIPHYLYIPGEDHQLYNIGNHFNQAIDFIKKSLQNTNILVHCMAGISRSVSLVLAYLMKEQRMTFQQAFNAVKKRRRIINPNRGFLEQLKHFERSISQRQNNQRQHDIKIMANRSFTNTKHNSEAHGVNQSNIYQQRCKSPQALKRRMNTNMFSSYNNYITESQSQNIHNQLVYKNFKNSQVKNYDQFYEQQMQRGNLFSNSAVGQVKNKSQFQLPYRNQEFDAVKQNNCHYSTKNQLVPQETTNNQRNSTVLTNYKQYNDLNRELEQKIQSIKAKYQEYTKQLTQNKAKRLTVQISNSDRYSRNTLPLQNHNRSANDLVQFSKDGYHHNGQLKYQFESDKKINFNKNASSHQVEQNIYFKNKIKPSQLQMKRQTLNDMQRIKLRSSLDSSISPIKFDYRSPKGNQYFGIRNDIYMQKRRN